MAKIYLAFALLITFTLTCPNDPLCESCSGNYCDRCYKSYSKDGVCTVPSKPIANCVSYETENACSQCKPGFGVVKGVCVECKVPNCFDCQGNANSCSVCMNNILVKNGRCDPQGDLCPDQNCQFCKDDLQCKICKDKFAFDGSTMTCKLSPVDKCEQIDFNDATKCMVCLTGYYDDGKNHCVKSPDQRRNRSPITRVITEEK